MDPFETQRHDIDPTPQSLGGYRLLGILGRGGLGTVYEAEPTRGGPRVALKTLQGHVDFSLSSLKDEFRRIHDLAHPNLVRLGELVTTDRVPFFTMELLRGKAFDEYVRASFESSSAIPNSPFNEERLRDALRQLAEGLNALHSAGIIHRDIKPSNVMVTGEGRVVILDMGLAIQQETLAEPLATSSVAGTPYFMAPEQASRELVGPPADWYAVGVMLFEALTGERAFQSRDFAALLQEKQSRMPLSPRQLVSAVPADLDSLCQQLLLPNPLRRPEGTAVLATLHGHQVDVMRSTVWIGRQRELEKLQIAWQSVVAGQPQVVFVSGRSGMGKTTLVDYFLTLLRREQSVVVLRGRCYENEAVAYRGFDSVVDALAHYLRTLSFSEVERVVPLEIDALCQLFPVLAEVPAIAHHRSRFPGKPSDPRERRQRGFAALRELLCRLSRFTSLVIFIDDLQQGDEETASLFRELFRRDEAPDLLLLATYRSEDVEVSPCLKQIRFASIPLIERVQFVEQVEVTIEALDATEATRLASLLLAHHGLPSSMLARQIATEAAGDPLFIRMLCDYQGRQRATDRECGQESTAQTWTLERVIEDRFASLSANEKLSLELLATAGRPVAAKDVESLVTDSVGLVQSLRAKRLIRRLGDREQIEPFHDKIRETICGLLSESQLSDHCLTLARQLDRPHEARDVEFLANLYRRGGDTQRAGECYEAAAAIADSTFAFFRAIECYRYAIELLKPQGSHEKKLRKSLGDALANASRSAEAAREYLQAATVAEPGEQAQLQQLASLRYLTSGHVEEGINSLREVLSHYQLPWPERRSAAVAGLLVRTAYLRVRGYKVKPSAHRRSDPLYREQLDACWGAAAGLSLVDPLRGSFYIAETLCRCLRLGDTELLPRALAAYMGQVAIGGTQSRREIHRVLLACRDIGKQRPGPYQKAFQFLSRGIAALLRGQWSACRRCCDVSIQYLADPECFGRTWELNTARTFALWALQYQGNLVEVARRQPELMKAAKESDDLYATLNFSTQVMANLQLASDQPGEALRRLEEDKARLSSRGFYIQHHNYVLAKTYTLLYLGREAAAMDAIEGQWMSYRHEFLSFIQQVRIDHHQVLTRACMAAAASGLEPDKHLKQAQKTIHQLRREKAAWATALATAFEAACAQIQMRSQLALDRLSVACVQLDGVGMRLFATAARQHLANTSGRGQDDVAEAWQRLGVTHGQRMANALIPGFPAPHHRGNG